MKVEDFMDHEIDVIRKAFHRFDYDSAGTMRTKDIGNCLRWLKLVPTEAQIADFEELADPDQKGTIRFTAILACAATLWISDAQKRDNKVWSAFLAFDKTDSGKFDADTVRSIFMDIGEEPITEKELKQIMRKFANKKDKTVEYGYMIRAWQK